MCIGSRRTVQTLAGLILLGSGGCGAGNRVHEGRAHGAAVRAEMAPGGLPMVVLENAGVSVAVVPELGAKIVSIRDRRSGREWLWRNPHVALRRAELDAAYVDYDMSGWDECFPSVGNVVIPAGPWAERPTGDHGELWCRPADVTIGTDSLTSTIRGARFPYEFRREIRLIDERTVRIVYAVRVEGAEPIPALWAGHALFALGPGMRFEFPEGTMFRVRSDDSPVGLRDTVFAWPVAPGVDGPADLSVVTDPRAGWIVKLFTESLRESWARIRAPNGDHLTLEFPGTPYVGLWINYGGVGGAGQPAHANVGIEPTSCPAEHPLEARDRGLPAEFEGATRWTVTVRLGGPLAP